MTEMISEAYGYTSEGEGSNASDLLSRAIRALQEISTYDEIGAGLYEQLVEVDSLLILTGNWQIIRKTFLSLRKSMHRQKIG